MRARGITLIELVVVIALIGILAAVASLYIAPALEAYFASQRRAALADVADTAMRRMMRDVRLALPNSARTAAAGSNRYLEILLTRTGGRYRALGDDDTPPTTEDLLDFSAPDDAFDAYETAALLTDIPADQRIQAGDYVVIHNLGIAGADAYQAGAPNIAQIAGYSFAAGSGIAGESRITLAAPQQFALESPGRRFFVVSGPVSYACINPGVAGGNGTGELRRWSGYAIQPAPPTAAPGGIDAVLASQVSACEFQYAALPLAARGLVAMRLAITRAGETVTLFYEAHVNNVP